MPEPGPLRSGDPETIAGYRLTGLLGEGGQGSVYLGEGPGGDRVAVKVLHVWLGGSPAARKRFAREVAATARVAPFCTARVLAADVEGDRPFLVSEYVEGPSLRASVEERGPLDPDTLRRLAIGTLTALAAIHDAGIVHRDFTPGNVLLSAEGPRVVDFGIARVLDAAGTVTGQAIGTPAYLAPEQFSGGPLGPAVDLFAWACTMVFAASGTPPFGNDTVPAVLARILHGEPDLGGLAEPVRGMAAACLAKDPAARPGAHGLIRELLGGAQVTLADAVRAATVPVPHPSPPPVTPPPARPLSRRGLLVAAGVAAIAGTGGTAAALLPRDHGAGGSGTPRAAVAPTRDRRTMWTFPIPGDRVDDIVAGPDGIYLISSHRLHALDPRTGRPLWATGECYGPLALSRGGTLYTGRAETGAGPSPRLQAVEPSTGARRWTERVEVLDALAIGGNVGSGQSILLAGRPAGAKTKRVQALHLASGRPLWTRDLPIGQQDEGVPDLLSASPDVVVVNAGRTVYGLVPATGERRWTFRLAGGVLGHGAVLGGLVCLGYHDADRPPVRYGLDAATGRVRWRLPLDGDLADGPRYAYGGASGPDPTATTPTMVYLTSGGRCTPSTPRQAGDAGRSGPGDSSTAGDRPAASSTPTSRTAIPSTPSTAPPEGSLGRSAPNACGRSSPVRPPPISWRAVTPATAIRSCTPCARPTEPWSRHRDTPPRLHRSAHFACHNAHRACSHRGEGRWHRPGGRVPAVRARTRHPPRARRAGRQRRAGRVHRGRG
jgi:hypothetical protein